MTIELLISCMYQNDISIVTEDKLQCDVLVINQCNKDDYSESMVNGYRVRMISTRERGLSVSRNMAINNSQADICLICDDDEVLMPDCAKNILQAFERHPKADIITFALRYGEKKFANIEKEVKYVEAMKTSSLQIAFRRKKIQKHRLSFNIKMGSGTGNGGGEEIKFLFDCLKAGLVIWYVPIIIASIQDGSKSQWFKGFTRQYFFNKGWSNKMILGKFWACINAAYFTITHYNKYKNDCSFWLSFLYQIKGTFQRK